eukprot:SAG22_NODE_175_length_16235_cov_67.112729_2_plen_113_part_00
MGTQPQRTTRRRAPARDPRQPGRRRTAGNSISGRPPRYGGLCLAGVEIYFDEQLLELIIGSALDGADSCYRHLCYQDPTSTPVSIKIDLAKSLHMPAVNNRPNATPVFIQAR